MNASIRLEEILQLIVDSLSELIGTPAVAVSLLDTESGQFELAATRALADVDAGARQPASTVSMPQGGQAAGSDREFRARVSSLAPLLRGGEGPSVVADTRDRPDLIFPTLRDGSTPRSVAISPIRLSERVLGVVEAYSTEPNHFSEDDTALLAAFADQAATAIETARLFGQARELALLQERDRIAKELHDGIIQTIYAVGLNLDYCRLTLRESPDDVEARLGDATSGLNRAISDIRNYIMNLTHRVGEVVGLREAAEGLAREYGSAAMPGLAPVAITVDVDDEASTAVAPERRAELVQVLREALANCRSACTFVAGRGVWADRARTAAAHRGRRWHRLRCDGGIVRRTTMGFGTWPTGPGCSTAISIFKAHRVAARRDHLRRPTGELSQLPVRAQPTAPVRVSRRLVRGPDVIPGSGHLSLPVSMVGIVS